MILIRRDGESGWRDPDTAAYEDEAALQRLLESSPDLLPGFVGTRLITAREVPTTYGPADLVVLDEAGNIGIVECKLQRNAEIKRKVVGQLIEYASASWRSDPEDFMRSFERSAGAGLEEAIHGVAGAADATDWDMADFHEGIAQNLREGRFHLIFAVDVITPALKDSIEFLNAKTTEISVLGIELRYVRDGDVEILVPQVYGQEVVQRRTSERRRWSVEQALERLADEASVNEQTGLRNLIDWSRERGADIVAGVGGRPTLNAWFDVGGNRVRVWYFGYLAEGGGISLIWKAIRKEFGPERAQHLIDEVRTIPGAEPRLKKAETATDNSLPLELLTAGGGMTTLITALSNLLDGPRPISP